MAAERVGSDRVDLKIDAGARARKTCIRFV
jgi:hypothetical protein